MTNRPARRSAEEVDVVDQAVADPVGDQYAEGGVRDAVGDLVVHHPVALGESADALGPAERVGPLRAGAVRPPVFVEPPSPLPYDVSDPSWA